MTMADQSRRQFLVASTAVAAAAAFGSLGAAAPAAKDAKPAPPPYDGPKLKVAIIGTGARGMNHVKEVNSLPNAEIIALCDVDSEYLAIAGKAIGADESKLFGDYREVLKLPQLQAVVVATPDHNHAWIAAAAMRAGKHVFCEKPLCHTVAETRALIKIAAETGVITQTGIQIHSKDNYRRVVELIKAGAIGPVSEVHIWNNRSQRPYSSEPCDPPKTLNYDLWSAPLPVRPFQRGFHPYSWREWWHFANGLLGDVGSHFFDVAFWALDLKYPSKITSDGAPDSFDLCSVWNETHYEFAAEGDRPALTLSWYDPPARPRKLDAWKLTEKWAGEGIMFVGKEGMLYTNYGEHALLPEAKFKDYQRPSASIPSSPGHQAEWVDACLAGDQKLATTPFSYGGLLGETALLGAVAFRAGAGKPLEYDAANLKFPNMPEAEKYLHSNYREGWKL
jgi:predicted dehydrogenase